ncbi:MAG: hypothetical protein K5895_01160 [Lachnospiraceae bacterium]|jgi:hypothetical protein|nr:hypothetical protein [Lachnospiraceae bacterium]
MRRKITCIICLISCLFALAGCGSSTKLSLADTEMDTVYISADGNVELVSVEDFDKKDYSESDLKSFIKDAVSEYNDKQGKDSVTMEDFTVKSKVAKVLLTFNSVESYAGFQNEDLNIMNIEDVGDNMVLPTSFTAAKDDSLISKDDILSKKGLKMMIIGDSALHIEIDGTVMYYADANLTGSNSVETTEGQTAVIIYK